MYSVVRATDGNEGEGGLHFSRSEWGVVREPARRIPQPKNGQALRMRPEP